MADLGELQTASVPDEIATWKKSGFVGKGGVWYGPNVLYKNDEEQTVTVLKINKGNSIAEIMRKEQHVYQWGCMFEKVDKIRKDEVRKALKRMKSGKEVGPDDIPVEVWKCLGEAAVEFLASLFNRVLENLEKAYDRVPREELWYCMRKSGVAEKYVRVVQDMYERSRTVVRCAVGQTEEFKVEVGLHQGSALSPFLFAIVMDQLSEEVRQESPWTMMFADDIVICSENREQVEENLDRWRLALEGRGMKVSRSKTEYMCVNEREGSGTVRLQGKEVKKVQEFKYLGSTVHSNGECGKEVKKRVQAGWNGWRKVSGVLCDQKISARIKGKVYRTVVRPAMLYGLETVSLRKRQESELEVAELKMLRFSLEVTRLDRIRNEYIRGTAHVGRLGDKVREARLRWFGHVQRRESEYIGRRMLDMELPGRRQRGRPKRRYMDRINEDMKLVGASVEDAEDRDRWREMIRCGDPEEEEEEEEETTLISHNIMRTDRGTLGTRIHYGKKASRWRQCHALGNILLPKTLGPAIHDFDMYHLPKHYCRPYTPFHGNELFEEHNKFEVLTWTSNSPNLNPIKHLWDVLNEQVQSMKAPPHNLEDLKNLLLTSWYQIPQHSLRDLVESMPHRDMFREAATNGETTNLEEYTSSVTSYIGKCIDDVTISKSITTQPN
ncbi:hypothetical protein QTP70_024694 [Hemibagrus guttatus]|uniref:ribonuclease H n=1 Tax=Hemibagrus guttatus TaxID=175788 RepID=A0AAE0VCV8_9TELE|nr:hypothetical protein QTP70_024694 [Hemibagrus guttatus]